MAEPTKDFQVSVLVDRPEYLTAIGLITVEMSNLEIALGAMLGALLHIGPTVGRTIYLTPKSAFGRFDVLDNATKIALTEGTEPRLTVERIIEKAKRYMGKRHTIVHDGWGRNPTTGDIHQVPFPVKQGHTIVPRPITELRDLVLNLQDLGTDVRAVTAKMYKDWPAYTVPEGHEPLTDGQQGTDKRPRKAGPGGRKPQRRSSPRRSQKKRS